MLVVLMVLVFKPVSNNIRRWLIISYIFLQVTCLLYQVNAVAVIHNLYQIFTRNIVIFPLSLYILFLPISLFFLDVQLDHHLFGQLSIPLVAAEALLPFQIWKAAVLIFTIRFFFKAKNIHQVYIDAYIEIWIHRLGIGAAVGFLLSKSIQRACLVIAVPILDSNDCLVRDHLPQREFDGRRKAQLSAWIGAQSKV